jgi:acyl-CoA hydrolase
MTVVLNDTAAVVEAIFQRCGNQLVIAAPLGLGKPNALLNALYQAVCADPAKHMQLYTALSLARPQPKPGLEQRFAQPFLDRHFGADYPDLDYVLDRRAGHLNPRVQVHEFYLQSGGWLGNADAQQQYASINYTHVARDVAAREPNLLVQLVARRGDKLSLSCNPDLSLDLLDRMRAAGQSRPLVVAVVHPDLPFLGNDAEVDLSLADVLLELPAPAHRLFALPHEPVQLAEHALGLHAAALVRDGGTLQIGIGALSDALVHALMWRHRDGADFAAALGVLRQDTVSEAESAPLQRGLYGASEMVMDGFMHLRKAGILTRCVYDDIGIQRLLNRGLIQTVADASSVDRLIEADLLALDLNQLQIDWLVDLGWLATDVRARGSELHWPDGSISGADLRVQANRAQLARHMRGRTLKGGRYLHGAFWLGTRALQEWLGGLQGEEYEGLCMTRVSHINELYGGREALDLEQRHEARFFNTCMMQTLLGAAVSDGLADGQVVSGVGGQYNFVAMAHAMPTGRSILMLRATREQAGQVQSNIVWSYPHQTIPRHLRDMVVSEYGVADLRGATDQECIERMLGICDARFIEGLANEARRAGKLPRDWRVPDHYQRNRPEWLKEQLTPWRRRELLPLWPFGCDFDAQELRLMIALKWLKAATASKRGRLFSVARAFAASAPGPAEAPYLARMDLAQAQSLQERILARLVSLALRQTAKR